MDETTYIALCEEHLPAFHRMACIPMSIGFSAASGELLRIDLPVSE